MALDDIKHDFYDYLVNAATEVKAAGPSRQSVTVTIAVLIQTGMLRSQIAKMTGIEAHKIERWALGQNMPDDKSFIILAAYERLLKLLNDAITHQEVLLKGDKRKGKKP